jgi:ribonuclease E
VHEQLHKALDRKVWLPSGGSLIIERTEALTVIDVNTGKNVGSSNLEETVFQNNLEAAEEIARQLRLRDIGGIIVIDFIDMEIKSNRADVAATLRQSLSRDKTPTQIFDISELGLVEMTRKRVGEGLVESLSHACPMCDGRGIVFTDLAV